jgi:diguanylate cyclase (GGDEF)-like protein/PAS domain S-box-containing protein
VLADLARLLTREVEQRRRIARSDESRARDRYALAISEARFASVFRHTPTGKAIVDLDGRFTDVNPKFCEITGYSADALKACRLADLWHPEHVVTDGEAIVDLLAGRRESYAIEKRCVRQDGKTIWVSLNVAIVRDDTGDPLHFIAVILDVTGRKETEAALAHYRLELEARVQERTAELERSRETLRTIADNLPILIAQVDRSLRYRFNNATYRDVFGIDPAELLGRALDEVLPREVFEQLHPYFVRVLAGERVTCPDLHYRPGDDRLWTATYVPDVRRGEVVGFYVMGQDVTEARRAERQLRAKAMQDALTGLPNRRALIDDLAASIAATAQRSPFALLFIDLDRFKPVNDALGHDAGDALLIHVAQRLTASVKSTDLVSRLAGDEFVVLARNVAEIATCERIAGAICRSLAAPFSLSGHEVAMSASVGAVLCTNAAGLNAEALLAQADAQMYKAKHAGGNRYCVGLSPQDGGP